MSDVFISYARCDEPQAERVAAALRALEQKMELAQQGTSQPAIADVFTELGAVFFEQGNYPASFDNYSKALEIYKQVGNPIKAAYSQTNKTNLLWRLGRFDEAKENLTEVATVAAGGSDVLKPLVAELKLIDAQIFLSQQNFSVARTKVSEALALAGEYQDTIADLRKLFVVGARAKHRRPLARSLIESLEQRLARADVDALRRLVEQQQPRFRLEPLREQRLLLVTTGERAVRQRRVGGAHVELAQERRGVATHPPPVEILFVEGDADHREGHVRLDRQRRDAAVGLSIGRDQRQPRANRRRRGEPRDVDRDIVDQQPSAMKDRRVRQH